ncbi:hypothetical protein BsWGS_22167 [Bradybaena similaris]
MATSSARSSTVTDLLVPQVTVPPGTPSPPDVFGIRGDVLSSTDKLVFAMTFVLIVIAILVVAVTSRDSVYTYFLSTRRLSFIPLACSMVVSSVGTAQFVGVAGFASRAGITVYAYELNAVVAIVFLGWIFFPIYLASGSMTSVDYLKKRYGSVRLEVYVGLVILLLIVTTKISVELYSVYQLLKTVVDMPPTAICIPMLLLAAMVPVSGGFRAVVYTNTFQAIIFVVGSFFLAFFCINTFSYFELKEKYFEAWPNTTKAHFGNNDTYRYTTCGIPRATSWHMFRSYSNMELPWPGLLFGIIINNMWYWCCDQLIVQTGLGARNIVQCKYACLITGYTKILSILYLVLPGIVARILHTDQVACADPDLCGRTCGIRAGCSNEAFPLIFLDVIPPNYRGFVLAAVVASCVTSLSSALHSGSAIFTLNIYRNVRSRATELELVSISKMSLFVLAVLGMSSFNMVAKAPALYNYMQTLVGVFAPPIVAVYVCGIFWDRAKEENAFVVLMVGLLVGLIRLVWEVSKEIVPCGDEEYSRMPDIIQYFHFLHFAIYLFVLCVVYMVVTGIFSEPILMVHLYRLIYWLRHSKLDRVDLTELYAAYKTLANEDEQDGEDGEAAAKGKDKDADESTTTRNCPRPLGFICCLNSETFNRVVSNSEVRETTKYQVSIRESSANNKALNIHAIILLLISAVMWGYFS